MSEASERKDDIQEHGIRIHHDASEGFDHGEPASPQIWAFTLASVIVLAVVIFALQQYFEKVWGDAVYQKVLAAPSQELQDLRNRDDWNLTHYGYMDKTKGQVRIPLAQAQDLFLKEQAAGKLFYPAKPTLPKKDEDTAPAGAAPAGAAVMPATNTPATNMPAKTGTMPAKK
jgi:hypothetical protein